MTVSLFATLCPGLSQLRHYRVTRIASLYSRISISILHDTDSHQTLGPSAQPGPANSSVQHLSAARSSSTPSHVLQIQLHTRDSATIKMFSDNVYLIGAFRLGGSLVPLRAAAYRYALLACRCAAVATPPAPAGPPCVPPPPRGLACTQSEAMGRVRRGLCVRWVTLSGLSVPLGMRQRGS